MSLRCAAIAAALTGSALQAQVPAPLLHPGSYVRATAGCVRRVGAPGRAPSPTRRDGVEHCSRYEGEVARLTPDSVVIRQPTESRALALADVRGMQVRSGLRRNWGTGAMVGGGIGLAIGLVGALSTDCSRDQWFQDLCELSQVAAPFAGAALGAGVGALLGGLVRTDRWERVALTARITRRSPGGKLMLGLALTL